MRRAGRGRPRLRRAVGGGAAPGRGGTTEAGETIGQITAEGTAGFMLFIGVPAGALAVIVFVLAGSLLPAGRAGGVVLGLVLLVLAGVRLEPLRADNFDFNLVGP